MSSLDCPYPLPQMDVRVLKAAVEGDMTAMREVHGVCPKRLKAAHNKVLTMCIGTAVQLHVYSIPDLSVIIVCSYRLPTILYSMDGQPFIWLPFMGELRW